MSLFDLMNKNSASGGDYQNGPTDHGTFIGTCQGCGVVWEFENYEVIPAPYPHGICPNCFQWVAVY